MNIKLLIVDDNNEFRSVLRHYLLSKEIPFELSEADSAEQAVALARDTAYDLILLDVRLPGLSGIEAAGLIKADDPQCKIIVLTMFEVKYKYELLNGQIDAVVSKSDVYDRLYPVLKQLIELEAHV